MSMKVESFEFELNLSLERKKKKNFNNHSDLKLKIKNKKIVRPLIQHHGINNQIVEGFVLAREGSVQIWMIRKKRRQVRVHDHFFLLLLIILQNNHRIRTF